MRTSELIALCVFLLAGLCGCEPHVDRAKAQVMFDKIARADVKPNAENVIDLPAADSSLSLDGKLYTTPHEAKVGGVLFVTWRGKGSNFRGYFVTELPLGAFRLHKDYGGSDLIDIIGPNPASPPEDSFKNEVHFEKTDSPNWYSVWSDSD